MPTEVRPVLVSSGHLQDAAGSASAQVGRTVAYCSVRGPFQHYAIGSQDGKVVSLSCAVHRASFAKRRLDRDHADDDAALALSLRGGLQACVAHPNMPPHTRYDVTLQIISSDGADATACCAAAAQALMAAGIELLDIPGAATVAWVLPAEEQLGDDGASAAAVLVADPSASELDRAVGTATCGMASATGRMLWFTADGCVLSVAQMDAAMKLLGSCVSTTTRTSSSSSP